MGPQPAKHRAREAGSGGGRVVHRVGSGGKIRRLAGLVDTEQTIALIALQSVPANVIFGAAAGE